VYCKLLSTQKRSQPATPAALAAALAAAENGADDDTVAAVAAEDSADNQHDAITSGDVAAAQQEADQQEAAVVGTAVMLQLEVRRQMYECEADTEATTSCLVQLLFACKSLGVCAPALLDFFLLSYSMLYFTKP
jgi:hypothetical protein